MPHRQERHCCWKNISPIVVLYYFTVLWKSVITGYCGYVVVKLLRTYLKLGLLRIKEQFIGTSTALEHYVAPTVLFFFCLFSVVWKIYAQYVSLSPQVFSQWRWKLVICASGEHPFENNMPRINQEKIRSPILRWMQLPLSGLPTNWAICTGNAITEAIGKDCTTTSTSGLFFFLFFFLQPFSQVIGEVSCKWMGRNMNSSPECTRHIWLTPKLM